MIEQDKLEQVGYVKYTGAAVQHGIIDAGSAGTALIGLDEALRFFNGQQASNLATLEYEIPVQTRPGSWEAVVLGGVMAVGGAFALGYAKKAGEKLAENDFKEIGLKDVFRKSLDAIKTLAKLVKHTRRARGWEGARLSTDGSAQVVLLNERGDEFLVPVEYFRWYQQMPPGLLVRLTSVIRQDRVLAIGITGEPKGAEEVIVETDKPLFEANTDDELEEDVLFPELIHGQHATLEGRLIRGSEASNSVGLEYQGHVINCVPAKGSIRQYKLALFLRCRVSGHITRMIKSRFVADRRPTLIVDQVTPLERDMQGQLF